jgi:hypothetical protein
MCDQNHKVMFLLNWMLFSEKLTQLLKNPISKYFLILLGIIIALPEYRVCEINI